jgi:hypothetical protein
MNWLSDIKRRIVTALREAQTNGELYDQFMIAATIGEPAFRVRAELKSLRGERLVRESIRRGRIVWELTARGETIAWGLDQQELTP